MSIGEVRAQLEGAKGDLGGGYRQADAATGDVMAAGPPLAAVHDHRTNMLQLGADVAARIRDLAADASIVRGWFDEVAMAGLAVQTAGGEGAEKFQTAARAANGASDSIASTLGEDVYAAPAGEQASAAAAAAALLSSKGEQINTDAAACAGTLEQFLWLIFQADRVWEEHTGRVATMGMLPDEAADSTRFPDAAVEAGRAATAGFLLGIAGLEARIGTL